MRYPECPWCIGTQPMDSIGTDRDDLIYSCRFGHTLRAPAPVDDGEEPYGYEG